MNLKIMSSAIGLILILASCSSEEIVVIESQVKKDLCPNCNEYELLSEYTFSDTELTEEYSYCKICDIKSPMVYRTYAYSQRCSGNCGYDVSEDLSQHGARCPQHLDVWRTQLKEQNVA